MSESFQLLTVIASVVTMVLGVVMQLDAYIHKEMPSREFIMTRGMILVLMGMLLMK